MAWGEKISERSYGMVDLCLDLAATLYESGATVQRVTDSVHWLARNLAIPDIRILVGYEAIELGMYDGDHMENRLYVLREPFRVNIAVLHQVSILLHNLDAYQGNIISIREELIRIRTMKPVYPAYLSILLTAIACTAFGWINHADIPALLVIGIAALCALSVRFRFGKSLNNIYLSALVTAITGGLCAAALIPASQTTTPDVALISSVLFLVPGFLLINGGLDIIRDHTSCGIIRLTSAFTHICIISGSLLIPLSILEFTVYPAIPAGDLWFSLATMSIAAGIAAFGFGSLFNAPIFILPVCMVSGIIARLVREAGISLGFDTFLCIFAGMVAATLLAAWFGKLTHVPEVFIAVIAGVPMVPGLALIEGLQGVFSIAHIGAPLTDMMILSAVQHVLYAGVASFAIIGGIVLPTILLSRKSPRI